MNAKLSDIFDGSILEEETTLSLAEICLNSHLPAELMIKFVDHGIITPCRGNSVRQWEFERNNLLRVDKALRLQRDLGVNLAGAALALDLLEEMDQLRTRLCLLQVEETSQSW